MRRDVGLGVLDHEACMEASKSITSHKKKSYQKWTEKERYEIGKYGSIHGHANAVRKFETKQKPLNESTVRRFAKLYQGEIEEATKQNRNINERIAILPREGHYFWAVWMKWCKSFYWHCVAKVVS